MAILVEYLHHTKGDWWLGDKECQGSCLQGFLLYGWISV